MTSRLGSYDSQCLEECDRHNCHVDCKSGRKLGQTILEAAGDESRGVIRPILEMVQNEPTRGFTSSLLRTALVMGMNERLGANSILAIVDEEIIRELVDQSCPLE